MPWISEPFQRHLQLLRFHRREELVGCGRNPWRSSKMRADGAIFNFCFFVLKLSVEEKKQKDKGFGML